MRYFVGIDPGWGGGIAVVEGDEVVDQYPMPDGELSLILLLRRALETRRRGNPLNIALEKVGGYMPGSAGNIGSAMFEFGRCYGAIVAGLHALNLPFANPTPSAWQKAIGVEPRGKDESKESHKRKLRDLARDLYPGCQATLKTCDAVLLAHYAKVT